MSFLTLRVLCLYVCLLLHRLGGILICYYYRLNKTIVVLEGTFWVRIESLVLDPGGETAILTHQGNPTAKCLLNCPARSVLFIASYFSNTITWQTRSKELVYRNGRHQG